MLINEDIVCCTNSKILRTQCLLYEVHYKNPNVNIEVIIYFTIFLSNTLVHRLNSDTIDLVTHLELIYNIMEPGCFIDLT